MNTLKRMTIMIEVELELDTDYKVKDLSLAAWGRKEIAIAETEMPGNGVKS